MAKTTQFDIERPTTILTQLGVQTCLPKLARGERRADFGLNKNARKQCQK